LTKNDWENWIFSDECPIYLFPTPNSQNDRIYSQSRENFQPSEQVKFSHVMVWGAMSASGLTDLHMVPQGTTVNAQYYIDNILETELLPALKRTKRSGPAIECKMTKKHAESVFVQDGAPAHTVKVTQRWCSENLSAFLKKDEWPPNSPDLNPVENLWAIIAPTTMAQLKSRSLKEWQNIKVSTLENLVHSMPKRLQTVREMKGGHSHY
jgi:transposase